MQTNGKVHGTIISCANLFKYYNFWLFPLYSNVIGSLEQSLKRGAIYIQIIRICRKNKFLRNRKLSSLKIASIKVKRYLLDILYFSLSNLKHLIVEESQGPSKERRRLASKTAAVQRKSKTTTSYQRRWYNYVRKIG